MPHNQARSDLKLCRNHAMFWQTGILPAKLKTTFSEGTVEMDQRTTFYRDKRPPIQCDQPFQGPEKDPPLFRENVCRCSSGQGHSCGTVSVRVCQHSPERVHLYLAPFAHFPRVGSSGGAVRCGASASPGRPCRPPPEGVPGAEPRGPGAALV